MGVSGRELGMPRAHTPPHPSPVPRTTPGWVRGPVRVGAVPPPRNTIPNLPSPDSRVPGTLVEASFLLPRGYSQPNLGSIIRECYSNQNPTPLYESGISAVCLFPPILVRWERIQPLRPLHRLNGLGAFHTVSHPAFHSPGDFR